MHGASLTLLLTLSAAGFTYWGVGIFRSWAEKRLLDVPNDRSSHTRPTPRGGGLIIVLITLLCGTILAAAGRPSLSWPAYFFYVSGAILVAGVSWIDDLRSLSSFMRMAAHLCAAAIAILGYGYWQSVDVPLVGTVALGFWGAVLAMIWIVSLTNAFNFMDGTDGIAAGQALVAGFGWAFLGWQADQPFLTGLGMVLAGSCLGFLVHNWPPARIFMGDVGSAFLGYTLAVMPLMYGQLVKNSRGTEVAGLLLVWPFVFDSGFTLIRRLFRRENVFKAHRSHLYQRMSTPSSGHARVAILYTVLALTGVVLAHFWSAAGAPGTAACMAVLLLLCFGLWLLAVVWERRRAAGNGPVTAGRGRL